MIIHELILCERVKIYHNLFEWIDTSHLVSHSDYFRIFDRQKCTPFDFSLSVKNKKQKTSARMTFDLILQNPSISSTEEEKKNRKIICIVPIEKCIITFMYNIFFMKIVYISYQMKWACLHSEAIVSFH